MVTDLSRHSLLLLVRDVFRHVVSVVSLLHEVHLVFASLHLFFVTGAVHDIVYLYT